MKNSVATILLILFALNTSTAQNTVGLLTHNGLSVQDGYTLVLPCRPGDDLPDR